jgi:hypothetical protein
MMSNISFFKLWHEDLSHDMQRIVPGNLKILNQLNHEEKHNRIWEYLQEYRIHFADLELKTDYVGFASASFAGKFGMEANKVLNYRLENQDYVGVDLAPTVASQSQWIHQATNYHVGMDRYIFDYAERVGIDQSKFLKPIVYCNSFICSTEVYLRAREIFVKNVFDIFEEANYNLIFTDGGYGPIRKGGCLSERLWGLTLSHCSQSYAPSVTNIMWRNMVQ